MRFWDIITRRSGQRGKQTKATSGGYTVSLRRWWDQPRHLPPFDFHIIRRMLFDGEIGLCLAARSAPLSGIQWAYQDGESDQGDPKYTSGIRCDNPEVALFVQDQLRRIWSNHIGDLCRSQIWGWAAGEIVYRRSKGQLVIDRLEARQAVDTRYIEMDGEAWGVRISQIKRAGHVDLAFPKAYFVPHRPDPGEQYGNSILFGSYEPWWDKHSEGGALDVRRLFMHKDAYGGVDIAYPTGSTSLDGIAEPVPNQNIARQIAEQLAAGGVTTRPSDVDENGNESWKITRATVPANPVHILQYPKDLDAEIRHGCEVPDGVVDSEGASTGHSGKRSSIAAFYASLDEWARCIYSNLKWQSLDWLVEQNFGPGIEYEIDHKPLAAQAMDQQEPGANPASQPMPFQPQPSEASRMSLIDAVGDGAIEASRIVKATRAILDSENA